MQHRNMRVEFLQICQRPLHLVQNKTQLYPLLSLLGYVKVMMEEELNHIFHIYQGKIKPISVIFLCESPILQVRFKHI